MPVKTDDNQSRLGPIVTFAVTLRPDFQAGPRVCQGALLRTNRINPGLVFLESHLDPEFCPTLIYIFHGFLDLERVPVAGAVIIPEIKGLENWTSPALTELGERHEEIEIH
jgi:hypothetical protein